MSEGDRPILVTGATGSTRQVTFSTVPGVRMRAKDPTPLDTFTIRG